MDSFELLKYFFSFSDGGNRGRTKLDGGLMIRGWRVFFSPERLLIRVVCGKGFQDRIRSDNYGLGGRTMICIDGKLLLQSA